MRVFMFAAVALLLHAHVAEAQCTVSCGFFYSLEDECRANPCIASTCRGGRTRGVDCGLDYCCPPSAGKRALVAIVAIVLLGGGGFFAYQRNNQAQAAPAPIIVTSAPGTQHVSIPAQPQMQPQMGA